MQTHDIGFQKRAKNAVLNPRAMTKEGRRVRRAHVRRLVAEDLFEKEGKVPRGWQLDEKEYWRQLYRHRRVT